MAVTEPDLDGDVHVLYRDHHGWLVGWLRRKLGGSDHAMDLAQDTFVRVLRRRHQAAAPTLNEPRAYLTKIAHALVVDHWRRGDLERAWLQALAAIPAPQVPSPESQQLIFETLLRVDAELDTLKPAAKTAFLLAQVDGLSCPQIARQLGVSLSTVERYLAQALRLCYTLRFDD